MPVRQEIIVKPQNTVIDSVVVKCTNNNSTVISGKFYVKLGHFHVTVPRRLHTAEEVKQWYCTRDTKLADDHAKLIKSLFKGTFGPSHEIMVHSVLRKLILQTRMRSHTEGIDVCFFGRALHLPSYFMYANSVGSGETARVRRLA